MDESETQGLEDGLVVRSFNCACADVVYVKSIVTAYDGLCALFSDGGGSIKLVAPRGREAELDLLVDDLRQELSVANSMLRAQEM